MKIVLWFAAAFLIGPLLLVVWFSFKVPEAGGAVTLRYYQSAMGDPSFLAGMGNSLLVSLATMLLSGLVGVSASLAARLGQNPWIRRLLATACVIPLLTPELLIAVGAASIFDALGIPLSLWTVIVGHSSFGVPMFFLLTDAALSAGNYGDLIRAARDLGAPTPVIVRRVVLPLLWPQIVSSAVLIWALTIDEVVLAFFLSGSEQVLTVRLYSMLRTKGLSAEINVACVLLMLLVVTIWVAGHGVRRKFAREAA